MYIVSRGSLRATVNCIRRSMRGYGCDTNNILYLAFQPHCDRSKSNLQSITTLGSRRMLQRLQRLPSCEVRDVLLKVIVLHYFVFPLPTGARCTEPTKGLRANHRIRLMLFNRYVVCVLGIKPFSGMYKHNCYIHFVVSRRPIRMTRPVGSFWRKG